MGPPGVVNGEGAAKEAGGEAIRAGPRLREGDGEEATGRVGMETLEARGWRDGGTTADGGKVKARGRAGRARREVPRGEGGDGGGGRRRAPGRAGP